VPYADLGDIRLYFEEYGSGVPVIFLHGFTLDRRMWSQQADYFSQRYYVILLDARGHGLSSAPNTGYSRDDRVEDLLRFVEQLGLDKFHLVGLSMGGSTAIGFALKYQTKLRSMTIVSTGAAGYKLPRNYGRYDELAKTVGLEAARAEWRELSLKWFKGKRSGPHDLMKQMIDEHSGAIWLDPMRGKYPSVPDLEHVHEITVPTFIIAGERDRVFVPLSQQIHERIAGSRLSIMKDAGHMLNLERPNEFNTLLDGFLESV
jgi:pimeloyl-ACP methyl ester carboxylesterase